MYRNRFIAAAAFAAFMALSSCTAATPPATTPAATSTLKMMPAKIRLGVTNVAIPTLIIAQEQGLFAKENLTVEKSSFGSGGAVTDALAVGQLDLGVTSPILSILATVKGAKTVMVSALEYTFTDKTGKSWEAPYVVVRGGEGIQKLTDLKGKKVAVNDIANIYYYHLRATMLVSGIDPDKEMNVVPVPHAQMPGALMQKLVDAIIIPADGYLQVQKMGKVDVIATNSALTRLDMDLPNPLGINTDFLQKNPDAAVRFLRALIQARQWMAQDVAQNDGKNLTDLVGKSMKYSPELALSFYQTRAGYYGRDLDYVNMLDIPTRVVSRNFQVLKLNGLLKPDAPDGYEQVVDIRPLQRAYATLGIQWDESKH